MRILHLIGEPDDCYGVTSVLRNLNAATARLGWEHVVWAGQSPAEQCGPALACRVSKFVCCDSAGSGRALLQALRAFGEIKTLLKQEPFDLIHAHSCRTLLVGLAVAARLNRAVVITGHEYSRHAGLYRWASQRERIYTVLLTPNMVRHYGMEIDPPRVRVISACCADGLFSEPLIGQRTETEGPMTLRLAGVGGYFRWQRWHLVLQALMQLAETERNRVEFSLWAAAPGDAASRQYEVELCQAIKRNRLERQVRLSGPAVSPSAALRPADCLVHPAMNEPGGLVLIEAMALGLPVVAADSGASAEIVQDGKTGLLFAPDNPTVLADQLRRMLRGKVRLASPAEIRESVRHRSASGVVKDYQALYEHALQAR